MRAAFPVNSVLVSICFSNISRKQPGSSQDDCIKCPGISLTTVNEGSISSKQCVSKYLFSNISSKQPESSQDDFTKMYQMSRHLSTHS